MTYISTNNSTNIHKMSNAFTEIFCLCIKLLIDCKMNEKRFFLFILIHVSIEKWWIWKELKLIWLSPFLPPPPLSGEMGWGQKLCLRAVLFSSTIWLPHSQLAAIIEGQSHCPNVNHCIFFKFWPEGNQELSKEVGSLTSVKHLVGCEPRTFQFICKTLSSWFLCTLWMSKIYSLDFKNWI